jgi:hypothetical protein
VEVNSGWGDTTVVIAGLPDAAVKESQGSDPNGALLMALWQQTPSKVGEEAARY